MPQKKEIIDKQETTELSPREHIATFLKAVVKTSTPLLGVPIDYLDQVVTEKRFREVERFATILDERLSRIEIQEDAREYWENTIVFKKEEIVRKLITEPGKGFDVLMAEYVASALSEMSVAPTTKDLILSTLLGIDKVDLEVLMKIDHQFGGLVRSGKTRGASFSDLTALLEAQGIDSVVISRAIQRLQAQDLIFSLNTNTASIQEMPAQEALLRGEKSPQHYSQSGFGISAFGRAFIEFLKLDTSSSSSR